MPTSRTLLLRLVDPADRTRPAQTNATVTELFTADPDRDGPEAAVNARPRDTWRFLSSRGWFGVMLGWLCHAVGTGGLERLTAGGTFVLDEAALQQAARALEAVVGRVGDPATTAVLREHAVFPDSRLLDQELLGRLRPQQEVDDGEHDDAEALGLFLLSLQDAVGRAQRERRRLAGREL